MDEFLKDNSVVTIYLESEDWGEWDEQDKSPVSHDAGLTDVALHDAGLVNDDSFDADTFGSMLYDTESLGISDGSISIDLDQLLLGDFATTSETVAEVVETVEAAEDDTVAEPDVAAEADTDAEDAAVVEAAESEPDAVAEESVPTPAPDTTIEETETPIDISAEVIEESDEIEESGKSEESEEIETSAGSVELFAETSEAFTKSLEEESEISAESLADETGKAEEVDALEEVESDATDATDATDTTSTTETSVEANAISVVDSRQASRINPVNLTAEVDKHRMPHDTVNASNTLGVGLLLLLVAIMLLIMGWMGIGYIDYQVKEQGAQTLRDNIMDASMQCFALEGSYPSSLEYLQNNYDLSINENDYAVVYVSSSDGTPPTVDVRVR